MCKGCTLKNMLRDRCHVQSPFLLECILLSTRFLLNPWPTCKRCQKYTENCTFCMQAEMDTTDHYLQCPVLLTLADILGGLSSAHFEKNCLWCVDELYNYFCVPYVLARKIHAHLYISYTLYVHCKHNPNHTTSWHGHYLRHRQTLSSLVD